MSQNKCEWCEAEKLSEVRDRVYWELPDGSRAIEITETPSVFCDECKISYQSETTVKEIEDQLFLINTKNIGKSISYAELMTIPRLLKRNYFDFSS